MLPDVGLDQGLVRVEPEDWRLALNVWVQVDVVGVDVVLHHVLMDPGNGTVPVPIVTQAWQQMKEKYEERNLKTFLGFLFNFPLVPQNLLTQGFLEIDP